MTSIKLMKKGFTLVELLVVVAMLAILMGSMGASVSSAQERAREQKALSDVKVISQALLASENYETSGNGGLTPMNDAVADANNLKTLLGEGPAAASGGTIPAMLSVALSSGKTILDPWGTPYRITIKESSVQPQFKTANGNLQTGFYLPNFHRLSESER